MSTQAAQRPTTDLTEDQLRRAWQQYKLPTWPSTFEEAMDDAVYSRMVRLHASHLAHPTQTPEPAPVRPPAPFFRHFAPLPAGYVDRKRAAAGDRDDD